jgi:hypothetical protein
MRLTGAKHFGRGNMPRPAAVQLIHWLMSRELRLSAFKPRYIANKNICLTKRSLCDCVHKQPLYEQSGTPAGIGTIAAHRYQNNAESPAPPDNQRCRAARPAFKAAL